MMKYLLVGTCAAVLLGGGVALAQMPPGGPGGPGGPGADGPHGPMGEGRMGMMRHHRGMPHGTAFHFRKGDSEIDIACSEHEPLQSCVTGAATLLDKLGYAPAAPKP